MTASRRPRRRPGPSPRDPTPGEIQRTVSLLQATLDSTADGILVVDAKGRVSNYNRRFLEMWRIPPEVAAAGPDEGVVEFVLSQLADPDAFCNLAASNADDLACTDGRVIERDSQPQRLGADVVGRVWTFRDVTVHRRAERLLADREARLRVIVQSSPECVKLLAPDGTLLDMNPAGLAMIEADTLDQVRGQPVIGLVVPEHQDAFRDLARRVFRGQAGTLEFNIVGLKGTCRALETHAVPLRDADGAVTALLSVTRDVTERRRAEQGLKQNRDLLMAITEGTGDAVFAKDLSGRYLMINTTGAALMGTTVDAVVGRTDEELWSPDVVQRFRESDTRIIATGRLETGEETRETPDGVRTLLVAKGPLRDQDGRLMGILGVGRDITDRRHGEEALRQSEERYRAFLVNSGEAIWRVELDQPISVDLPPDEQVAQIFRYARLAECNEAMARVYDAPSAEALVGARIADFLLPTEPRNIEHLRAFVTGGYRQTEAESFERDQSGRAKAFLNNLVGIVEDGRLVRIWGTQRDITDRKRAEQVQTATYRISESASTVRNLDELYRSIHEIVSGLIPARNFYVALYDPDERMITFPYFVDEYDAQYPPKRLGKGLTEYVLRTGRPLLATPDVYADLERRGEVELIGAPSLDWMGVPLRVGDETIGVLVVQTYSEGVRYGEAELSILQFVSDQVARAIERRRAAARLSEIAARYQQLFDANPEAMWVYDEETLRILAVNDAAVRRYGYSEDEFLELTIEDLRPPEDVPALRTLISEGLKRIGYSGHWYHRKRDASVIEVDVTSHELTFAGRPARLVLARDVTETRRLEEQLRQAQKMEAVGRLAGGIAHDFNNLLTAILGTTQLLLRDLEPGVTMRDDVEEIRKAALRAADLTRQLLAYSRRQVLAPKVLDLNTVVANLDTMLRRLIGEDVHLVTELAPHLTTIQADPSQLEQVILNLIVNSRDAMPHGGRVTIRTAHTRFTGAETTAPLPAPGAYALLEVIDTGTGMTAEVKAHLFEPFFTTKEVGKGTGLGLATVYGVVKQSGGYIWVESETDRGTTVRIAFPVVAGAPQVREAAPPRVEPVPAGETVLLVEDEEAVRRVAAKTLVASGYRVLSAKDGPEALAVAAHEGGKIDLLLTDMVMPGMTGRELAEQLTAIRPATRVLYMSGYTEDEVVRATVAVAGHAFLQKPFDPEALARKVREVLDGRTAAR